MHLAHQLHPFKFKLPLVKSPDSTHNKHGNHDSPNLNRPPLQKKQYDVTYCLSNAVNMHESLPPSVPFVSPPT